MSPWRIHHRTETVSTNVDAREGRHGDVYTADFQTSGRGRLDHVWISTPGTNLMMSVVLCVEEIAPETIATLPLIVGYAVVRSLRRLLPECALQLKWPNDVILDGRKVCGILCERSGDNVIAGIGVNVNQTDFPPEIAGRATSLAMQAGFHGTVASVRDAVLSEIASAYAAWKTGGLSTFLDEINACDFLRGRFLRVLQTDSDSQPICGIANGIQSDGSLLVGDTRVYAGEAHIALR